MLSVAVKDAPDGQAQLHASTISYDNKALVLAGPTGSGKSSLALRLISLGARLIADDVTWLAPVNGGVEARCPPALQYRIEVRGMGILNAAHTGATPVHSLIDLGYDEADRLPPRRFVTLCGVQVPCLHKAATPYFAEALIHYVMYGRSD